MGHSRRLVWNNKPFPLVNEPSFADFLKRKKKEASYCLSPSGSPLWDQFHSNTLLLVGVRSVSWKERLSFGR